MTERMIFLKASCGVGMSYADLHDCAGMSDDDINDMAWELAIQCAESFGSYYGDDEEAAETECDDMFHGDRNFTNDNLDYWWEDYNADKHDCLLN